MADMMLPSTPTPGENDYPSSESLTQPPNNIIYHSASYETTPLLSFAGPNESIKALHSSGRNYNNNTSNRTYNNSGRYTNNTSAPKYPSNRSYQQGIPGLYAVLLTVVLQSIGFTLVLPSMYLYLKSLNGATYFYGWVVAIYSAGSFIGSILFGWWSDYRNAKEVILVGSLISVAGNCLYVAIQFFPEEYGHWIMLVSRFAVGFGSGCVAVCRAYLAENSGIGNKVKMMAAVSGAQGIGFVIGPGLGSGLAVMHFHIGVLIINQYTSPGYLSAIFCLCCFFVIAFFMPAISTQKKDEARRSIQYTEEPKAPIFITLFLFFATVCVFAIFETDFTILSKKDFHWGAFNNSIYFLVAALISVAVYPVIGKLKGTDDRKGAAFGIALLKPWRLEDKLTLIQIIIGGVIYSIGYPIGSTYIFALYSKILNPQIQGSKMGWITATGSLARMLGPIWASNALDLWGDTVVFGGTAIFLAISLVVLFSCYRFLVPHKDYVKASLPVNA